jgi:hypothetical protein
MQAGADAELYSTFLREPLSGEEEEEAEEEEEEIEEEEEEEDEEEDEKEEGNAYGVHGPHNQRKLNLHVEACP